MADWDDFQKIDDDWSNFEEIKTPQKQGYQGVDTSDIWNNPNLTKEQKVQAIHERFQAENKRLDRENKWELSKLYGGAALELLSAAIPVGGGAKLATMIGKKALSKAPALLNRTVQGLIKGAPGALASGAVYGAGDNLMTGKSGAEAAQNILSDSATSFGVAKGLQGIGKGGQALLESDLIRKGLPKIQQLFNSVPAEYAERALQKELAGESIFKGKFDTKDLNMNYNQVGQKALDAMEALETRANKAINQNLWNMSGQTTPTRNLIRDISKKVSDYSYGGETNNALIENGEEINDILQGLKPKIGSIKFTDLHNLKDRLQTTLRNKFGNNTGTGVRALKEINHMLNDELANVSPQYAKTHELRSKLYEIKDLMNGMNKKTIASKLRNVEGDSAVRSGYNQAAEELDNLSTGRYKFMDDVKDLRAREALEQWFPGQYGGSGTSQGFANLLRTGISAIPASTAAVASHNPLWLLAFSPKISGKKLIQGLGSTQKMTKQLSNIYDKLFGDSIGGGIRVNSLNTGLKRKYEL